MIAKKIPPPEQRRGKRIDVAAAYGLTVDEYNCAATDFLQNEGYDSNGNEYATLHDWLISNRRYQSEDNTPWQKGDDQPG